MDEDNWLELEQLVCKGCGAKLAAMLHSPFCDDYRLYCDRCPQAIEVSYYDPGLRRLLGDRSDWVAVMAVIESALQGCGCGGRFRGDAARRCFDCGAVVQLAAGKDLMPDFWADLDVDRAQVQWDEFAAKFLGEGRWAADVGP
jgi:hypothetical protein